MKKEAELIISVCVTMVSGLVSLSFIPSPIETLIFMALVLLDIILYCRGSENGNLKMKRASYGLGALLAVVMIVYCVAPGLPSGMLGKAAVWTQQEPEEPKPPEAVYQENRARLEEVLEQLQGDVDVISGEFAALSETLKSQAFLSQETYQSEVQAILDQLNQNQAAINKRFPNLKTDVRTFKLFYKTQHHEQVYHYSSMIKAFETYGIDCKSFKVDEFTLMHWDVESLYILYAMKKELEPEWANNPVYSMKTYLYDEFKVSDMNELSDLFDYLDSALAFEGKTVQELDEIFSGYILNYYKLFHLNFSRKAV